MTKYELLSTVIAVIAIIFSISASIFTYIKAKYDSSYDVFDATYLEILKTAIDFPSFRNQSLTNNYLETFQGDEKLRYEIYAFICLNFCESIYDKGDEKLNKSWSVIIKTENLLHRRWFDNPENHGKFKSEFREYMEKEYSLN